MSNDKKDDLQEVMNCAYTNIRKANEVDDGMTAVVCLLGSISHSLFAIAEMMRDKNDE